MPKMTYSFRFMNDQLNVVFLKLLSHSKIEHHIDRNLVAHYSPNDDEKVENVLIDEVRHKVFDRWQVVSCPPEWIEVYRTYMKTHNVPFEEEKSDGELEFLLPKRYRPNAWKLPLPME